MHITTMFTVVVLSLCGIVAVDATGQVPQPVVLQNTVGQVPQQVGSQNAGEQLGGPAINSYDAGAAGANPLPSSTTPGPPMDVSSTSDSSAQAQNDPSGSSGQQQRDPSTLLGSGNQKPNPSDRGSMLMDQPGAKGKGSNGQRKRTGPRKPPQILLDAKNKKTTTVASSKVTTKTQGKTKLTTKTTGKPPKPGPKGGGVKGGGNGSKKPGVGREPPILPVVKSGGTTKNPKTTKKFYSVPIRPTTNNPNSEKKTTTKKTTNWPGHNQSKVTTKSPGPGGMGGKVGAKGGENKKPTTRNPKPTTGKTKPAPGKEVGPPTKPPTVKGGGAVKGGGNKKPTTPNPKPTSGKPKPAPGKEVGPPKKPPTGKGGGGVKGGGGHHKVREPPPRGGENGVREAIKLQNRKFQDAFKAGNVRECTKLYTKDCVCLTASGIQTGRTGVEAGLAKELLRGGQTIKFNPSIIMPQSHHKCLEIGRYTLVYASGSKKTGDYVCQWKKEKGEWKRWREMDL